MANVCTFEENDVRSGIEATMSAHIPPYMLPSRVHIRHYQIYSFIIPRKNMTQYDSRTFMYNINDCKSPLCGHHAPQNNYLMPEPQYLQHPMDGLSIFFKDVASVMCPYSTHSPLPIYTKGSNQHPHQINDCVFFCCVQCMKCINI